MGKYLVNVITNGIRDEFRSLIREKLEKFHARQDERPMDQPSTSRAHILSPSPAANCGSTLRHILPEKCATVDEFDNFEAKLNNPETKSLIVSELHII